MEPQVASKFGQLDVPYDAYKEARKSQLAVLRCMSCKSKKKGLAHPLVLVSTDQSISKWCGAKMLCAPYLYRRTRYLAQEQDGSHPFDMQKKQNYHLTSRVLL